MDQAEAWRRFARQATAKQARMSQAAGEEPTHFMGSTPARKNGLSRFHIALALAGAGVAGGLIPASARAEESAYCANLRAQIASAGANGLAARYRAAAVKQRGEYEKLVARGQVMGCDREQFLIFGEPPPPQCANINARIGALRESIAAYERGGADDSQRAALAARYDAECRNVNTRAHAPRNFFEELFGVAPPDEGGAPAEAPGEQQPYDPDNPDGQAQGGSQALCVRSCDGGFFPLHYSAAGANLDDLNALCKALCPNAEVALYTRAPWREIDSAVSINGEPYSSHPNALKYQKSYDPSCGCKPPDKSWAEALEEAERMIAERNSKDQVVTVEQAEQMSRPITPADPAAKPKKRKGQETAPELTPAEAPRGDAQPTNAGPETYRDVVGPDGVKRRVRVVAPTL